MERLVVVHNPDSTRAAHVGRGVFDVLDAAGLTYTRVETRSPATEDNIYDMQNTLRDGDRALIAAGDGTVMQAANAILRNGLHASIAPLGYGNFNDQARGRINVLHLASPTATTYLTIPLTIEVDGQYWRHAPAYFTAGWTATAAEHAGSQKLRERAKHQPEYLRMVANLAQAALQYFSVRGGHLPSFCTADDPTERTSVTDIAAINSRRAAGIVGSSQDWGANDSFGYREFNLNRVPPNIPFIMQSLTGHAQLTPHTEAEVIFTEPATIPAQSEGEFQVLEDITRLKIYKNTSQALNFVR